VHDLGVKLNGEQASLFVDDRGKLRVIGGGEHAKTRG
jgi:hypothetical protein